MATTELDEALQRLHQTGPEFEGWLSNHGPMVVETLVRRGHGARVHRWLDGYLTRLDEPPRGLTPVTADTWRDALGDPKRIGDWREFFLREVTEQAWPAVLATWWPRLLPGLAASATHGVIRTGHAVQALRAGATPPRIAELGHALAYWACGPRGRRARPSSRPTPNPSPRRRRPPTPPTRPRSSRERLSTATSTS